MYESSTVLCLHYSVRILLGESLRCSRSKEDREAQPLPLPLPATESGLRCLLPACNGSGRVDQGHELRLRWNRALRFRGRSYLRLSLSRRSRASWADSTAFAYVGLSQSSSKLVLLAVKQRGSGKSWIGTCLLTLDGREAAAVVRPARFGGWSNAMRTRHLLKSACSLLRCDPISWLHTSNVSSGQHCNADSSLNLIVVYFLLFSTQCPLSVLSSKLHPRMRMRCSEAKAELSF